MLNYAVLNIILLFVALFRVIVLSDAALSVIMLIVTVLSAIILIVNALSIIMLNVVSAWCNYADCDCIECHYIERRFAGCRDAATVVHKKRLNWKETSNL